VSAAKPKEDPILLLKRVEIGWYREAELSPQSQGRELFDLPPPGLGVRRLGSRAGAGASKLRNHCLSLPLRKARGGENGDDEEKPRRKRRTESDPRRAMPDVSGGLRGSCRKARGRAAF